MKLSSTSACSICLDPQFVSFTYVGMFDRLAWILKQIDVCRGPIRGGTSNLEYAKTTLGLLSEPLFGYLIQ